jgi:hypothetical protein
MVKMRNNANVWSDRLNGTENLWNIGIERKTVFKVIDLVQ